MKKWVLIALFAALFAPLQTSSASVLANEDKKWVMLRVYLHTGNDYDSAITITYPDGKCERFPLLQCKAKNYEANDKLMAKSFSDLFNKGYKIIYSNNSCAGELSVTTYFMETN